MCACLVVVGEISGQDATQVAFAQNEDMIEPLVPDRADESLGEGILPRAAGSGQDFLDTHAVVRQNLIRLAEAYLRPSTDPSR